MNTLAALALCVVAVYAQTQHPHATHEPSEFESIAFNYVPTTHHIVVKQHVNKMYNCYVAVLTDNEIQHVHTDSGIRSAEIRILGLLSSATKVDGSSLDSHDVHACGHGRNHTLPQYYTIM